MSHMGERVARDGTLEFVVWGSGAVSGSPVQSTVARIDNKQVAGDKK